MMGVSIVDFLAILASLVTIAGGVAITIRYFRDEQQRHPAVIWGTVITVVVVVAAAIVIANPFKVSFTLAAPSRGGTAPQPTSTRASIIATQMPLPAPTATRPPQSTACPSDAPVIFSFEDGTEGWGATGAQITHISQSSTNVYCGSHALEVQFVGLTTMTYPFASAPPTQVVKVTPGSSLVMYVYVPVDLDINAQLLVTYDSKFLGQNPTHYPVLNSGEWNRLQFDMPASLDGQTISSVGLQFTTSGSNGTENDSLWIDSVRWYIS